jgi:hypothetical protein
VCNAQAKRVDNALAAEVLLSTQAAAARAAVNVTAGLGKNLVSPKTSYEFEAVWKGLSGNRSSQAHLLKVPILPLQRFWLIYASLKVNLRNHTDGWPNEVFSCSLQVT